MLAVVVIVVVVIQTDKKEYKVRTDSNSPTGPNIAARVAALLLYYLLDREKTTAKWEAPPHPPKRGSDTR